MNMKEILNDVKVAALETVLMIILLALVYNGFIAPFIKFEAIGVGITVGSFVGLFVINMVMMYVRRVSFYKQVTKQ